MKSKSRGWIIGAVLVAVLILVGTWFLGVAPKLAEVEETRAFTEDELARQDVLRLQLATLQRQFEEIDAYRAELDELRVQMPAEAELSDLVRELHDLATGAGITLLGVTPGLPTTVVPVQPDVIVPEAEEANDDEDDITADPDATPTPAEPEPATRLVSVPLSLTAVGTYAQASQFIASLQESSSRLYLVTSFNASTVLNQSDASGGRPATSPGDVELSIDGLVYVLPEEGTAADDTDPEEGGESPAPSLPSSERNPFAPVAGS